MTRQSQKEEGEETILAWALAFAPQEEEMGMDHIWILDDLAPFVTSYPNVGSPKIALLLF